MPTDRWQRLERLFAEAVEQPAAARADFLARTCAPDVGLRDELEAMLTAAEQSGDFLEAPALDVFAQQISHEGWSVRPDDRIGSYTVERRLGAGAMGEVWRARDERLGRDVAIKLLLPDASNATDRVQALQREARAAGTLNHPNVLTVHDVGEHHGALYLVTECLEGESLRARLGAGALPVETALDVAVQVARGLGAAHGRGIVHRDLKPENIFVTQDGRVKILDFGLATGHDPGPHESPGPDPSAEPMRPLAGGTAGYMAPEQVRGDVVDGRADIFALGVVLHEMLSGDRPFKGNGTLGTLDAVLTLDPPDLSAADQGVSRALAGIVRRCLAKTPHLRFATAADVASALESIVRARNLPPPPSLVALFRRPVLRWAGLLVVLTVSAGAWRWHAHAARVRWARDVAGPEVQRLSGHGDQAEAFLLASQALEIVPDDPQLRQSWLDASMLAVVTTDPVGADVSFAPYRTPSASWTLLGRTPLNPARIPRGQFRVRVSKAGFQPIEGSAYPGALPRFRLDSVDAVPPGMVRVIGGREPVRFGLVGEADDFWIDRFEVTNRQFKEFVDQGGYGLRAHWQEPFLAGGRSVPWEEAIGTFRDATGRPGPATWRSGTYRDGEGDLPVGGVSWYEASAYAAFAGKSLPTIHHWYRAAGLGRFAEILTVSNFGGQGPAPVGSHAGLGPFGTYDMAGNLKEWCSTATNNGRFLLGGAWNEPRYLFADYDAKDPFERAPGYGFRLARYIRPVAPVVVAPVRMEALIHDSQMRKPVGDEVFAVYRRQHAYDRGDLNLVAEGTEETADWVKHTVVFDAAYGGERMRAFLFLPKNAAPPYQTVVTFPAGDAFVLRSSRDMSLFMWNFIVRSGRALLYPVYKGTYERSAVGASGPSAQRELRIAWSRDLGRAIDYLETRPDIDHARLAFYGVSAGGEAGTILTALEPRLKTTILQGTGLGGEEAPEVDTLNYAPRVRVPTLLLNGRYDFEAPYETSQRPFFALLGPPPEHKRHAVFETGHALPIEKVASEVLPWLDRYLGRVAQ